MRRLYLAYFVLATLGLFSLTVSHAYADFRVDNVYEGEAPQLSQNTQSWLEWEIQTQSGVSSTGRTDSIVGLIQNPLSFLVDNDPLRALKKITVTAVTDQSGIGSNYCYTLPNFTFTDRVIINGQSYDLGISQSSTEDEANPRFTATLEFIPEVVERLLLIKHGVIIQDGDTVVWDVSATHSFRLWGGIHHTYDSRIPNPNDNPLDNSDNFLPLASGEGWCQVFTRLTQVADHPQPVDRPSVDLTFFTTGMETTFRMTWIDLAQQLIDDFTGGVDDDGDGIPDELDSCTFTPENFNGYQDSDGCPDVIPLTDEQQEIIDQELDDGEIIIINEDGLIEIIPDLDFDNDGFANDNDFCPNEPENFNGIQDFDGCPDGVVNPDNNLLDDDGNPIIFDQGTDQPLIGSINQNHLDFIAENTDPLNPEVIIINVDTGIETEQGISDVCNPIFENCNQVIADAVASVEEATGIRLPFEPSILNFVIIFGVIGVVIFMIGKATKKI
jgi:hypothetical protein